MERLNPLLTERVVQPLKGLHLSAERYGQQKQPRMRTAENRLPRSEQREQPYRHWLAQGGA